MSGYWLLVTGYWYWLLVTGTGTGHWSLVTGHWLLATGHWLLVTRTRNLEPETWNYLTSSPGLVFHRSCIQTHCSGCFLICSSINRVKCWVFSIMSFSSSP